MVPFLLKLLKYFFNLSEKCNEEIDKNEDMSMTEEDKKAHDKATRCHIGEEEFCTSDKR